MFVQEWPSRSCHLSLSLSLSLTYFALRGSEFRITTWPFPSLFKLSQTTHLSISLPSSLGAFSCYKGYPLWGVFLILFSIYLCGILWPKLILSNPSYYYLFLLGFPHFLLFALERFFLVGFLASLCVVLLAL